MNYFIGMKEVNYQNWCYRLVEIVGYWFNPVNEEFLTDVAMNNSQKPHLVSALIF